MEQTAVEKMIKYFIEQKNNGCYQVCIHDLIAQLYQAKEIEKEQMLRAYDIGSNEGYDLAKIDEIEEGHYMKEPIDYYNETFKLDQ